MIDETEALKDEVQFVLQGVLQGENWNGIRPEIFKLIRKDPCAAYEAFFSYSWAKALEKKIPSHMHDAVVAWVILGIEPGSFLSSVITSNLFGAFASADEINIVNLKEYCDFFCNYAPSASFGSRKIYDEWRDSGGYAKSQFEIYSAMKQKSK